MTDSPSAPTVFRLQNILVPIDFSETSRQALAYAVPLARQFGARITLLHVVDLPAYPPEFGYMLVNETQDFEDQGKMLGEWAAQSVPAELLAGCQVRHGAAWDAVVNAARETGADLIVLTTHGYTGLKHALLGSTAERIVRHAPCPVLSVRQPEAAAS